MMWKLLILVASTVAIVACGQAEDPVVTGESGPTVTALASGPQETAGEVADETGFPVTEEEVQQLKEDFARADLALTLEGPRGPLGPGEAVDLRITVNNLKGSGAQGVTVAMDLVGLESPDDFPSGCLATEVGLDCLVPQGPDTDPSDVGSISTTTGPGEMVLRLRATGQSGSVVSVTGVVTSSLNDLDNDYNPTNNSADYTAEVG